MPLLLHSLGPQKHSRLTQVHSPTPTHPLTHLPTHPTLQVRGVSHEPVQERERPKSMLAAKSFNATSDLAALHGWFRVLAQVRWCSEGLRQRVDPWQAVAAAAAGEV